MRRPLCMVCLLFVITVFIYVSLAPPRQVELSDIAGKTVCLAGEIYQKEIRPNSLGEEQSVIYLNHIAVSGESESLFEEQENIQGVMCYMKDSADAPLGSLVVVKGKLQEFNQATNPGEFNSRQYYQILKLDFRLTNAEIVKMTEEHNRLHELLYKIKEKCGRILDEYYDETDAGIMKTILLGDKNSLSEEVEEQYKRNGIIHIMAISGLHISMLGMGLYETLKKCRIPACVAGAVTVLFIGCYGIMTGMSASACRAIIMFIMKITADIIGRTYDLLTALALAAVLLLLEQPLYVRHCGFLLSFGAVMGIGIVLPILEENVSKKVSGLSKIRKLLKRALPGIAVFFISFPIQIYYYYQYPIYSIGLNLLIIPLMTFVMVSGLFMLGIGALSIPVLAETVGTVVVFVGHSILRVYSFLCDVVERLPGSVFITGKPEGWQILLYYAALCIFLLILKIRAGDNTKSKEINIRNRVSQGNLRKKLDEKRENNRQSWIIKKKDVWKEQSRKHETLLLSVINIAALGLGFCILLVRFQAGMEITFLDVGQGDCIYIRSETGKSYLIDGGSTTKSKVGEYQMTPFLKSKGVSSLEAVFVTHGDKDHYSGVEELLENAKADRIRIKRLILPVSEKEQEGADSTESTAAQQKRAGVEKSVTEKELTEKEMTVEATETLAVNEEKEGCGRLRQLAERQGIEVVYIKSGDIIADGKMKMECLNPSAETTENVWKADSAEKESEDKNEQSVVLYLTYGEFSALFTGDVTGEPEQDVSERMKQKLVGSSLTVLKVAHHGSMYSTDEEFLRNVRPKVSVISCGEKNSYGHPHEELLERLEECGTMILTTPEYGAISITVDKEVVVQSWRKSY